METSAFFIYPHIYYMTTRASKWSANQFWEDILFKTQTGDGCPIISFPFSDNLSPIQHGGCLLGTAVQGELLELTQPVNDTYGAIVYNFPAFQPVLNIAFDYRVDSPSSGNGADAVYCYFNSSNDPLTEDDTSVSGYCVGFSEYHQWVAVIYGHDVLSMDMESFGFPVTIHPGIPYTVGIQFNAGVFNVYFNAVLIGTCTDSHYADRAKDAAHIKFGLGARCGADHAKHSVYNLHIDDAIPEP